MKQKSIKSIRQEFRKGGVFYTPPELAEKLKEYVCKEPECMHLDPNEIRADARKTFLRTLRTTLDMEMLTCSLDGESIQPFIDDIKRILAEYDK